MEKNDPNFFGAFKLEEFIPCLMVPRREKPFETLWEPFETLWGKKKMLATSIFFFSHKVFHSLRPKFHHLKCVEFVRCRCFQARPGVFFVVW